MGGPGPASGTESGDQGSFLDRGKSFPKVRAGIGTIRSIKQAANPVSLGDEHADRKSTRLNSSHGYISYAVFCLKKKKRLSRTSRRQNLSTTTTCHISR